MWPVRCRWPGRIAEVDALTTAFVPPPIGDGWMPAAVMAPQLYIPTTTGLKKGGDGYLLAAPDNNPQALIEKLLTAMRDGSTVSVARDIVRGGVVIINGAVLPFAVVMPIGPS